MIKASCLKPLIYWLPADRYHLRSNPNKWTNALKFTTFGLNVHFHISRVLWKLSVVLWEPKMYGYKHRTILLRYHQGVIFFFLIEVYPCSMMAQLPFTGTIPDSGILSAILKASLLDTLSICVWSKRYPTCNSVGASLLPAHLIDSGHRLCRWNNHCCLPGWKPTS